MKFRLFLPFAAVLVLGGCKPIELVKEALYSGTLKGVEACMNVNDTDLLSENQIRSMCTKEQQVTMRDWYRLQGKARFDEDRIIAQVDNQSEENIVTEITFMVEVFDSDGRRRTVSTTENTWIAPNSSAQVSASFRYTDGVNLAAPWCESGASSSELRGCKNWDIESAKAVRF
jgi:small nuclear ribonucleoprotein (snRNP)-like protein